MTPLKMMFPAVVVASALGGCAQISPTDADRVMVTERSGYYSETLVTGSSFDDHDHWKWKDRNNRDDRKHDHHGDMASNDEGNRRDRRDQDRRDDNRDRKNKDDDSSKKKDDDSSRKTEREASGGRAHTNVVFTHASDGSRGPAKQDDSDKNDKNDKKDNDDKDDKKNKKD